MRPCSIRGRFRRPMVAAALVLSSAGAASAGTVVLNTNTLQAGVDANVGHMLCEAVNIGKEKPVSGTLEFVRPYGGGGGPAAFPVAREPYTG